MGRAPIESFKPAIPECPLQRLLHLVHAVAGDLLARLVKLDDPSFRVEDHNEGARRAENGRREIPLAAQFAERQMDAWASNFDSWEVWDRACLVLCEKTPFGPVKAVEWAARPEEFIKRAGFALMAGLAWHDKKAPDSLFLEFLPVIVRESTDKRNYVKKAVNWALRQIGKRNSALCQAACETALQIRQLDSPAARWIAADALRELKKYCHESFFLEENRI